MPARANAVARSTAIDGPPAPRRVDPRVVQTERAVVAATLALIERLGPGEVTVERIAEASGVARSTIYRRWPDVEDLFLEAFHELTRSTVAPTPTGDLRADLEVFARDYAGELNDPTFFAVVLFLMDEALRSRRYVAAHRGVTRARARRVARIVAAARAAGAVPPTVDEAAVADCLMAPLFQVRVGLHRLLTDDDVRAAVDWTLATAGLPQARARRGRSRKPVVDH